MVLTFWLSTGRMFLRPLQAVEAVRGWHPELFTQAETEMTELTVEVAIPTTKKKKKKAKKQAILDTFVSDSVEDDEALEELVSESLDTAR
jgi:hypothetical protein